MKLIVSEVCKSKGISLKELAGKLGITNVGLSQQINGNPTIETLDKIASALEVDITELFEQSKNDTTVICPKCGAKLKINLEKNE